MVPHNTPEFEPIHATPAGSVFKVWPTPYYNVRNEMIKEWADMTLMCISELFQHSENSKDADVGPRVESVISQYMRRAYTSMAIQCFGKTREEVSAPGFLLTAEDFSNYNPDPWFTGTERTDTVPNLGRVFTEDMLAAIRDGILVTALPANLTPFPGTLLGYYETFRDQAQAEREQRGTQVDNGGTTAEVSTPAGPTASGFSAPQRSPLQPPQ